MLYHLRTLTDAVNYQQMVAGTPGANVVIIRMMLDKLQTPAPDAADAPLPVVVVEDPGKVQPEPVEKDEEASTVQETPQKHLRITSKQPDTAITTKQPSSSATMTSDAFRSLWGKGSSPAAKGKGNTPAKVNKPKQSVVKEQHHDGTSIIYRKEYYKANHSYGIKRVSGGKSKQIFSLSNKSWTQDALCMLADKVLHDLNKCKSLEEEHSIELLAKYKLSQ